MTGTDPSSRRRERRVVAACAAAAAVLVLLAGLVAVRYGPLHRALVQRRARPEAQLAYPGATVVDRVWHDEEHARYIDTGGYDEPAGWTLKYSLGRPVEVARIIEFYEGALRGKGWAVAFREEPGTAPASNGAVLRLVRGPPEKRHRLEIVPTGPVNDRQAIWRYSVEYRMPYERAPRY